jgi:hypothetical protein
MSLTGLSQVSPAYTHYAATAMFFYFGCSTPVGSHSRGRGAVCQVRAIHH